MTIKFSSIKGNQGRVVRETTAPFVIVEKGEERTEQLRVQYYSLSIKESKEFRKRVNERKDDLYVSDILLPVVHSLPDLVDDKDKPIKITLEVLETLNAINLRAIQRAIEADLVPKDQPAK